MSPIRKHNSSGSSEKEKPKPKPQPHEYQSVVSALIPLLPSTLEDDPNSVPEACLNHPFWDSLRDVEDAHFKQRKSARKAGYKRPHFPWEILSKCYQLRFEQKKHGLATVTENNPPMGPSPNITLPLFKFQKEFLEWGLKQEASPIRGGILADEMGMGKKIQAISLVVTARDSRENSDPSSSSFKRNNNKCTLLICQPGGCIKWEKEIANHTVNGSVRVLLFHNANRPEEPALDFDFSLYDIVLTDYFTVQTDYDRREEVKASPLLSETWERIILDEAHAIKDRRSNKTKGVFALKSQYKWALTGIPLQNRMADIFSLIKFLQVEPYTYRFCIDCKCDVKDLRGESDCPTCNHPFKRHFVWWNKFIAKPIGVAIDRYPGKLAMFLLYEKVLKSVLLRREKSDQAIGYAFPPKYVKLRLETMDETEQEFYQTLSKKFEEKDMAKTKFFRRTETMAKLQRAADHPYLVMNRLQVCGPYNTKVNGNSTEMKPRKPNVKGFKNSSMLNRLDLSSFKTSTKIEALKEEIRNMIEEDGSGKGIVFSQFLPFLDLIGYALNKCGIKWVMLDGSVKIEDKDKTIAAFTDDADCKILLMGLAVGGVASKLTVASHVFLMDPSDNPAAEKQAIDRIHRIGQHKPIRVIKFVMKNTIDEDMMASQRAKEQLFEGSIGKSPEELAKLTGDDRHSVFKVWA